MPEWRRSTQATSLAGLRIALQEDIDDCSQPLQESTNARLVRAFFGLESEADKTEREMERLDRVLGGIRVPGEGEDG